MDQQSVALLCTTAFLKTAFDYCTATIHKADIPGYSFLLVPIKDLLISLLWDLLFFSSRVVWPGMSSKFAGTPDCSLLRAKLH